MKICPQCKNKFEDEYGFCLQDGTPLTDYLPNAESEREQGTYVNSNKSSTEDDTFIRSDSSQFGNAEGNPADTSSQQSAMPTEEWKGETPSQHWRGQTSPNNQGETVDNRQETSVDNKSFAAAQIPINQFSENRKSYTGIIIGAVALFGIIFLGTAIVGAFLYFQNQDGNEVASTANISNSPSNIQNESSNINTVEENITAFNLEINSSESVDKNQNTNTEKIKSETKPTSTKTPDKSSEISTPTSKPTPVKTPTPLPIPKKISKGVLNGSAVSLPKPPYPPAARAVGASGAVNVQVEIDQSGNVVSANAVSGHPLLRQAAESAARRAKFQPTMLSGQAVRVTGVIIYNFVP